MERMAIGHLIILIVGLALILGGLLLGLLLLAIGSLAIWWVLVALLRVLGAPEASSRLEATRTRFKSFISEWAISRGKSQEIPPSIPSS